MSENEKKGGKFKSLFFRDVETPQATNPIQNSSSPLGKKRVNVPTGGGGLGSTVSAVYNPVVIKPDNNLVDTFVQKLQDLINQSNQPGFDFLEFTETLFEESENPNSDVFKTVFRIAQKMDKTLTPEKLLQSASYYKNLAQQAADGEVSKGQSKKNALQGDKDSERRSLEKVQQDADTQITKLNSQISELQSQSNNAGSQLSAIDQKYNDQFLDIDTKISAITTAKEQVISSIVDVETGIKNNLK